MRRKIFGSTVDEVWNLGKYLMKSFKVYIFHVPLEWTHLRNHGSGMESQEVIYRIRVGQTTGKRPPGKSETEK
jgi:hypothetical protein